MSTITDGATTVTPTLVLGHEVSRRSRTVIHPILGRPDPDVTLREAALRRGTLRVLFPDAESAYVCFSMHAGLSVLTLTTPELPSASMSYVVDGDADLQLDEDTRERCVVEIPFQEVAL